MRIKRSFWVKLLILLNLIIAMTGWVRLYSVLNQWEWLQYLQIFPPPAYFAITGLLLGIAGLISAVGLWLMRKWGIVVTHLFITLLALWFWADQLLFTRSETSKANWPFLLGATLLFLGYTYIVLIYEKKNSPR